MFRIKSRQKLTKVLFCILIACLVLTCTFFIMFNAEWLIGDDAIVVRKTGWGHFFKPADTVAPSAGRFYPFAYLIYNVLPLFGLSSVNAHFALLACAFLLFCVFICWTCLKAVSNISDIARYLVVFAAVSICIQRVYANYLDAYSTAWLDYTLIAMFALCTYYIHYGNSRVAAVLGWLIITFLCYCSEINFVMPLSYGVLGLFLGRKNNTRLERIYLWSLVFTAVLFLVLYYFICFVHIDNAYDGSHGSETGLFGNLIKMFVAQKVLWLGLAVLCGRSYCVFKKKEKYEFWDTMILSGFAYCCGCAILRLNWTLYYSFASVFMVPAIIHYLTKYLNEKWSVVIMLALAVFMCRKIPTYIRVNQDRRKATAETFALLERIHESGEPFYWYSPVGSPELDFNMVLRDWQYYSLETLMGRQFGDEFYNLQVVTDFDASTGVYLLPGINDSLSPEFNKLVISEGIIMNKGNTVFTIVKIG